MAAVIKVRCKSLHINALSSHVDFQCEHVLWLALRKPNLQCKEICVNEHLRDPIRKTDMQDICFNRLSIFTLSTCSHAV